MGLHGDIMIIWLVVFRHPSEKYESVGMMTFPTEWIVIIHSCSSHHQPGIVCSPHLLSFHYYTKVMWQHTMEHTINTYYKYIQV